MPGWRRHVRFSRVFGVPRREALRAARILDVPPPGVSHRVWRRLTHTPLGVLAVAALGADVRAVVLHIFQDFVEGGG